MDFQCSVMFLTGPPIKHMHRQADTLQASVAFKQELGHDTL